MKALAFEDFAVGDEYAPPARAVTEADVMAFAGLSGDTNPVPSDAVFAVGTPYGLTKQDGTLVQEGRHVFMVRRREVAA
jgi:acyl dehydratase